VTSREIAPPSSSFLSTPSASPCTVRATPYDALAYAGFRSFPSPKLHSRMHWRPSSWRQLKNSGVSPALRDPSGRKTKFLRRARRSSRRDGRAAQRRGRRERPCAHAQRDGERAVLAYIDASAVGARPLPDVLFPPPKSPRGGFAPAPTPEPLRRRQRHVDSQAGIEVGRSEE
jgi:hypothetical protein